MITVQDSRAFIHSSSQPAVELQCVSERVVEWSRRNSQHVWLSHVHLAGNGIAGNRRCMYIINIVCPPPLHEQSGTCGLQRWTC